MVVQYLPLFAHYTDNCFNLDTIFLKLVLGLNHGPAHASTVFNRPVYTVSQVYIFPDEGATVC